MQDQEVVRVLVHDLMEFALRQAVTVVPLPLVILPGETVRRALVALHRGLEAPVVERPGPDLDRVRLKVLGWPGLCECSAGLVIGLKKLIHGNARVLDRVTLGHEVFEDVLVGVVPRVLPGQHSRAVLENCVCIHGVIQPFLHMRRVHRGGEDAISADRLVSVRLRKYLRRLGLR